MFTLTKSKIPLVRRKQLNWKAIKSDAETFHSDRALGPTKGDKARGDEIDLIYCHTFCLEINLKCKNFFLVDWLWKINGGSLKSMRFRLIRLLEFQSLFETTPHDSKEFSWLMSYKLFRWININIVVWSEHPVAQAAESFVLCLKLWAIY